MATPTNLSLVDFTAYELPAKRWMKLVRPKMRLRVRSQSQPRDHVSPSVHVGSLRRNAGATAFASVCWPWDGDARFPPPCVADDAVFEVEIERRCLLWYSCIRRTQPVTLEQIRTGDHCALPLYDKRRFTDVPEERLEIGEITFTLRNDTASEDASSEGKISLLPTYDELPAPRPRTVPIAVAGSS